MSPVTTHTTAPTAWDAFRVLLQSQREDCVQQRELALVETVASHPDPVAVTRAATLLTRIGEIDAALERIDDGTYGTCMHCQAAIPVERLEFRPFAVTCVACPQPAH
jgi:DnaK suppressor protein